MNPRYYFQNPDLTFFRSQHFENSLYERKSKREPEEIAKLISAFSNYNKDGGLIVVGVSDDGKLTGINCLGPNWENGFLSKLSQIIHQNVYDHKKFEYKKEDGVVDYLFLIYVKFSPDKVIEKSDGSAYRRIGDNTVELNDEQKLQLKYSKGQIPFEDQIVCEISQDILDSDILSQYIEGIKKRDGAVGVEVSRILSSKHFTEQKDGKTYLRNSGLILLGKDPTTKLPGAKLRFIRFEGKEEKHGQSLNIVKDQYFEGPVPSVISKSFEFIKSQIKEFSYLGQDGKFAKEPEYPYFVILESIVNALAHRSYSLSNTPVFVKMFDDKLVIESPGRFPGTVTPESFYHFPTNPRLMDGLRYFDYVQAMSEGTKRMKEEMLSVKLPPPEFKELEDRVVLTLYNGLEARGISQKTVSEASPQYLNLFQINVENSMKKELISALAIDENLLRDIKKSFIKKLIDSNWIVTNFSESAFNLRNPLKILKNGEKNIVEILPGFRFSIRKYGNQLYLILDPSVNVNLRLNLQETIAVIGKDKLIGSKCYLRGKRVTGTIIEIGNDFVKIRDRDSEFSSKSVEAYPRLKTHLVQDVINNLRIDYNLDSELKRYSILLSQNAPRERSNKTTELANFIATNFFPIKFSNYNVTLDQDPARLSTRNFSAKKDLREIEISFDPLNKYRQEIVLEGITKFGSYDKPEKEINVIILTTNNMESAMDSLYDKIVQGTYKYSGTEKTFSVKLIKKHKLIASSPDQYLSKLESFLGDYKEENTLFLIYMPEKGYSRFDYSSPYYLLKKLLLEKGYPSQMVDENTLADPRFKDLNLALNIFAKLGNTPWVLSEGFPDVDLFIGLSYSSIIDKMGNNRVIGYVNVFDKMGRWRFYKGNSENYKFEDRVKHLPSLIKDTLSKISKERKIKKVHIHHSSKLSRDLKDAIYKQAIEIIPDIELVYVWVNEDTPLRAYDSSMYSDGSLARGSYLITSPNQIYLSTTGHNQLKQKGIGTPKILEINIDPYPETLTIDPKIVAQHILNLTKLNWASTKSFCHLPITLKYASDIAYIMNAIMRTNPSFKLNPKLEETTWFI